MQASPSRDAVRMLEALDPEGRELYIKASTHDQDAWGERVMARRIAAGIPDPVALTYRQIVDRTEELMIEFITNSRDERAHDYTTCAVPACERCGDEWEADSVRTWLLEELVNRRNKWLAGETTT